MKKNNAGKIKTLETVINSPDDLLPTKAIKKKKKPLPLTNYPILKPRRSKQYLSAEQVEYVNAPTGREVQAAEASSYTASITPSSLYTDYPYDADSTQVEYFPEIQPFDSERVEYINVVPEGEEAEAEASSYSDYPYDADSTQVEYFPEIQPFDLEKSEYANLAPMGVTDDERIYIDPEGSYVTIPKKQPLSEASIGAECLYVDPINSKKQPKKSVITSKIPEVQYATLDLTPPDYANAIQGRKIGADTVEYSHLGADNRLTSSNLITNQIVGPIKYERKKTEKLAVKKTMSANVDPNVESKIRLRRKKNRSKDNYPGSLSTAFEKLKISIIKEENTQMDNSENQSRFSFFRENTDQISEDKIDKSLSRTFTR